MKERIKHMIYEIKTFVYHTVGCKVRTTYAYYYYLCFKELFKKLLKPKKMIAVKWRINPKDDYKFVTYVEDSFMYKSTDMVDCFNSPDKFKFRVKTINVETTIEPLSYFYILSPNILYWFNNNKMKWEIFNGDILNYEYKNERINFNFSKLSENANTLFFLNLRDNSIAKIDGEYCDLMKDSDKTLSDESLNNFIDFFRI